jgi:t-SNARE complex subunit (syntaxin)
MGKKLSEMFQNIKETSKDRKKVIENIIITVIIIIILIIFLSTMFTNDTGTSQNNTYCLLSIFRI